MRSSEMGASSDRLSFSAACGRPRRALSVPRPAGPESLSRGRRRCDCCCSNTRRKLSATSSGEGRLPLPPATGAEAGRRGAAALLLGLPWRRKYSSPVRSWTARDRGCWGCWGCGGGWKKSVGWGSCREPGPGPRMTRALHGVQGRSATSRTPTDTSSGSLMSGALDATQMWAEGGIREGKRERVGQSLAQQEMRLREGQGVFPLGVRRRAPGSGGRCPWCWSPRTGPSRAGGKGGQKKARLRGSAPKLSPLPSWSDPSPSRPLQGLPLGPLSNGP